MAMASAAKPQENNWIKNSLAVNILSNWRMLSQFRES